MAAPAVAEYVGYGFRDAKGNTARMRLLIGGASTAAVLTAAGTGLTNLQAVTNAHAYETTLISIADRTYGTSAQFATVEDKAVLTFASTPSGSLHRFQVPAPLAAVFYADLETVYAGYTAMGTLLAWFSGNVYGSGQDTSPLTYIGGTRVRRKQHRRLNILIKDPTLTEPGE